MKVKDEPQWQAFRQHVRRTGGPGMRKLMSIFVEWSEATQLNGVSQSNVVLKDLDAYPILKAGDIGELFVLAIQFWPNGEEFYDSLSPLESKLVAENLELKMLAQQEIARKTGERADMGADA